MSLITWDPFADLVRFDDVWRNSSRTATRGFSPALDVHEDKEAYHVKVDLPGVKQDEVKVSVEDQTLVIRGERKQETERTEKGVHISERRYGSFARSLMLPETVNADKIVAKLTNGVLQINVPKTPGAQPKMIEVKAD